MLAASVSRSGATLKTQNAGAEATIARLPLRPRKECAAQHSTLAGLASCGVCGGGLVVETSGRKAGRVPEYVCTRHRHNGTCANALRIPVAGDERGGADAVEEHVFTPEAIEQVIALTERDELRERRDALHLEA